MEQQRCTLVNLYFTWTVFLGVSVALLATGHYYAFLLCVVGTPLFQAASIRLFPRISRLLGYGSVADKPAVAAPSAPVDVTLYTAVGCPFCPIIEERLDALKPTMGFTLTKIDITLRPDLVSAKKIKGVPVVEVGDVLRTGNLTSQDLAELIGGTVAT